MIILQFGDYQEICASDKENLEHMTRKLKDKYEKWGLQLNIDKIQYICIIKETTDLNLDNNEIIEKFREL